MNYSELKRDYKLEPKTNVYSTNCLPLPQKWITVETTFSYPTGETDQVR